MVYFVFISSFNIVGIQKMHPLSKKRFPVILFIIFHIEWFSEVSVSRLECVKGIIVPHAGWTFSIHYFL